MVPASFVARSFGLTAPPPTVLTPVEVNEIAIELVADGFTSPLAYVSQHVETVVLRSRVEK